MKSCFLCQNCGVDFAKWVGKCPHCKEWDSLKEIKFSSKKKKEHNAQQPWVKNQHSVISLDQIEPQDLHRISSEIEEFDRILGGGLVLGSVTLIGGAPGAGKSTILLQIAGLLVQRGKKVLYASGEESAQQIALHAERLQIKNSTLSVFNSNDIEQIIGQSHDIKCDLLIVDSIQVMHTEQSNSSAGSVNQVRECASALVQFAKQTNTIVIIVGHITKDGSLAGPKVLEHMVDCSLLLTPMEHAKYKSLRSIKNRFGATGELGIFANTNKGIVGVSNPSAIFLARDKAIVAGSIITATWEGSRSLLVEMQTLVDKKGSNKRVTIGLDSNRVNLLLAVLSKHGKTSCHDCDVFANVVGGIKIEETSADLPLLLAICSSMLNKTIPNSLVCFGEVGLSGELRPTAHGQERLQDAVKHGFTQAIIPLSNKPPKTIKNLKVQAVGSLAEAIDITFNQ